MKVLLKSISILLFILFVITINTKSQVNLNSTFKVEARKWVKDKPNQPWSFFDTQIIDSLKGFKPSKKVLNAYGSKKSNRIQGITQSVRLHGSRRIRILNGCSGNQKILPKLLSPNTGMVQQEA